MLRDLKFFRHNSGRNPQEGNENLPAGNQADSLSVSAVLDPSRPPLNTILESTQNPRTASEHEPDPRGKIERTPSKRAKKSDSSVGFRTPEKLGMGSLRSRFGWSQKVDVGSDIIGAQDEGSQAMGNHPSLVIHASSFGNASLTNTPRVARCGVRTLSNHSESGSTQSTPTKSVTKPPNSTFSHSNSSRPPLNLGTRTANFSLMSKGVSSACIPSTIVNTIEVPHLELKEDPSFWMDHNVQVLIRIRPLNNAEKNLQGYNRCLKQDSAQTVTWLGQPETRFTFDHVACETVNQEMLFRVVGLPMVENCLSGYNSSIFAYGQTGSGKTYTMLGEINELELRPSTDRGMTPRIFEFLFARIRAEEESRMDEKLKYNCKCSFLEIYNEQITDLLDSSSTNLLIREDIRKGVYVENLTEYEVETVNDILKLLIQGAANRKVAATNMNRESSRSHSVFTCVIESRWEKDSTINLRYARLNLVDLAGSERQKTSGAEGDRLKEAANINKSLSTLGHVIMVLVDLAQGGKHRHVPYRDSRLTFLLQDSLGGNSKTMIIANVSPSICSAAETLSTLKFAQRAKLIQNNAIVNEDASGDVRALQCQIHLLKEELSFLKRQNVSRSLSFQSASLGTTEGEGGNTTSENKMLEIPNRNSNDFQGHESSDTIRLSTKKLKSLETILAGALRREEMAESNVKHLQAEIEQLNRLVRQREEDGRCSKMLLRFREDKIQRMESLVNGLITTESYLAEQNDALSEEIRILQNRIDRNPEVTRFALENIRLLDQLRRFQEFYEEGEREILFSELSELRTQLFEFLSGRFSQHEHTVSKDEPQEIIFSGIPQTATKEDFLKKELDKTQVELNECRKSLKSCLECNENLTREIGELNSQLNKFRSKFCGQDDHSETLKFQEVLSSATMDEEHVIATIEKKEEEKARTDTNNHEIMFRHSEEIMNFQLELDILKIILDEERLSRNEVEQKASQLQKDLEVVKDELKDAKFVIEALESQQVLSINELDELRKNNNQYMELLTKRDSFLKQPKDEDSPLQAKLKRVQASLEYAKVANMRYQSDQASLTTQQQEMEEVQSQVEAETAEVIVCLQEELAMVQQQVDELSRKELEAREENKLLHGIVEERTAELSLLTEEWDKLACNVSDVLADGHIAIQEASDELEGFADSLLHRRIWVGEQMGRMVRLVVEKELLIEELQKSLDDAYKIRDDLEWKLRYLRGATLSLTESHQEERYEREKENLHLKSTIQEQKSVIIELENMLKTGEDRIRKAEVCATVAFLTVNRLSDKYLVHLKELKQEALKNEALRLHKSEEGHMEAEISDDILEAKGHLDELRRTVCTINSNIDEYVADVGRPNKLDNLEAEISANCYGKSGGRTEANEHTSKKVCDKDETIFLLRKEIESSLESLKGVQFQMAYLLNEREDIKKAQKEDKKTIKDLRDQIIELERMMNGIEDFSQNRMLEMANQLQNLGEMVQNTKEEHRIELSEAKMLLAQKAAESFSLISKFEEAQATIAEADVMVNALVSANEAAKLEIEKYKQKETSLKTERDCLNIEVKSLQSCMNMMDQKYNNLEKQYTSNMAETKSLACLFEDILAEVESAFKQGLASIFCEMHDFRFQLMHCMNLARTWLEDVWSDIIAKDCAISVLHLCHIGILLETVTGLNAENSLLQHGLSESNSVISDLRESTFRAKRELEMCTSLKGKLLIDIKNGFNRITKNEEDSGKLSSRISLFEKKILDLQMQEEYMLALCNSMGSQLSALIKDVDGNYRNALTTLLSQERSAWEIEEVFRYSVSRWSDILSNGSCGRSSDPAECIPSDTDLTKNQVEFMIVNLFTKDIQLLIVSSELKEKISELNEMTIWKANKKDDQDKLGEALEHLSRELILVMTKEELAKLMLIEAKAELGNLENKGGAAKEKITEMKVEKKNLKKEIHCLREALDKQKLDLTSQTNDFNSRLAEATEVNETLSTLICNLQSDKDSALKDQQRKEATLDSYLAQISGLQTELKMKEAELNDTQHSVYSLLNDLECERRESISLSAKVIAAEEKQLVCEIQESVNFKREMEKLSKVYEDIQAKLSKVEYSSNRLQERFGTLEACMTHLCMEFDLKMPELLELESSYSIIAKESDSLVKEIKLIEQKMLSFMCLDIHLLDLILDKVFQIISKSQSNDMLDNLLQEICNYEQLTCKFIAESECLETQAKELLFENLSLRSDLMWKEEIVKGLLFDLSLLQESTSKVTDQKDDFAEIEAHLESLEEDLAVKSNELDAALVHGQLLEKELQEKLHAIAALQLELGTAQESLHIVTQKNLEMKAEMVNLLLSKDTIQEELDEERKVIEQLEGENLKMSASIEKMNGFLEDLKCDFIKANQEKDYLASETIALKEQLEMAQALAEEHKAVATEAQQMAQMSKAYAEEKEEEAKLLEKSVEELECTINVLENKVELVRGEAEKQRMEREVLELELQALRHQILASQDLSQPSSSEENVITLQEAENKVQTFEKLVEEKDAEIAQCKMHITELNMHAEAQAREYKQKFKALEAMAQEVKPEPTGISHAATLATAKSEKNAVKSRASSSPHAGKSRGSGSPFKCIGLGLAHQFYSEKDEELTAGRLRIEELEALTASRQKEIFMLNARLAAAESMTHDVIRDLLGVKLDMSNCASLLDHQQIQKIAEKARLHNEESAQKDLEVAKLKQQLNAFINERQSWLDEINHKHAEMVAAHVALEKLRQRDQHLAAENEMLELENANQKKKVTDLEKEVKKLSGQQNLQQRIHHHAKIKEENNLLRMQNDDLSAKLQRSEIMLSRVKEELARYRSSSGKGSYIDIDEEQRLKKQLQDKEEERVQLAQKLLELCTGILKAAGITRSGSEINPSMAEEALSQLTERIASTERDLQDLKFKSKISTEKMRLSDLRQQSPLSIRTNENCPPTPVRPPTPLSPLSR